MKRILIVASILLVALSCKKETPQLQFKTEQIAAADLPGCKDEICPEIDIQLVKADGDGSFTKTINDAVAGVVIDNLSTSPDEEGKIKSIDEGLDHFIGDYREFKNEFSQSPAEYEIKIISKVSHQDENLICITMDAYTYMGGAHGYSSKRYLNFDVQTGQQLDNKALISDEDGFMTFVEKKFREQQDIPADDNINGTGYMFKDDIFALPANIGFEGNDMILTYNPYEVAAYAEGQIKVRIPVEEVKEYLAVEL